jgi:peptidoglycan/LPS O-acetylase OafA/YrhL
MTLPGLTGVRGVAALWVLGYHLQLMAPYFALPAFHELPILRAGYAGVDLFIVLSGFILMLTHEPDFERLSWERTRRFFALRLLRIYPMATVVLLLILLLVAAGGGFASQWLAAIPADDRLTSFARTLFLANRWWYPVAPDWNQPEWSLSVELVGYAVFPLLALASTRIHHRPLLAVLAAICLFLPTLAALFATETAFNANFAWGALPRMAGAFAGGVLLARLHRLTPEHQRSVQAHIGAGALLALVAALCVPPWGYGLATPLLGLIVYGLAANRGAVSSVMSSPVARWLGRVSFPLYLIQLAVLVWLINKVGNLQPPERWAALALGLVALFGIAWVLHLYVEQPIHRFARGRFARPAAAPHAGLVPANG